MIVEINVIEGDRVIVTMSHQVFTKEHVVRAIENLSTSLAEYLSECSFIDLLDANDLELKKE